jgi:hypothetical protein
MTDHHFSYPRVVPLWAASISGHAAQPPMQAAPVHAVHAVRLPQSSRPQPATAVPALNVAGPSMAALTMAAPSMAAFAG